MIIIYSLLVAAAFFGIIAWLLERKHRNSFKTAGMDRVPFSIIEQEHARIEGEIANRSVGIKKH